MKPIDTDHMPVCKMIMQTFNNMPFVLVIYDPEAHDIRQFSNGDPESQSNLLKLASNGTLGFVTAHATEPTSKH